MIIFKSLRYKNFLSTGDVWTNVDLDASPRTMILGANGSGKSTMLCALSFALFGKPHRKINKPQLINSINGKNTLVEVEFSIGSSTYLIRRGLKPAIFEIIVNGELMNIESHSRDYQNILETNILKLNYKSFHQVVVLGSSNFTPFMQLPAAHRRAVIEDLLDIGIFSKMNNLLKESYARTREDIKDLDYELTFLKDKIDLQTRHIRKLRELSTANIGKYDDEIQMLVDAIDILHAKNTELSKNDDAGDLAKMLKTLEKQKSQYDIFAHRINDHIVKAQKEVEFYSTHTACPTCHQDISLNTRDEKLHVCNETIQKYKSGKDKLIEETSVLLKNIDELRNSLELIRVANSEIVSNNLLIDEYKSRIQNLKGLKKTASGDVNTTDAENELAAAKESREKKLDEKSRILEERAHFDACAELLKDSGIKTRIIRQYLPLMNTYINQYLQILDFFVSFELDENFNETIRSRHRDEFSYDSFSEGEKSRIDLSIMFAWRQIAKIKNSANTNLLVLDEVFDSSLDTDGVENLLKIMNSLDEDTRLFVITHKPEGFEPYFDRKITAKKVGNYSTYVYETLSRTEIS